MFAYIWPLALVVISNVFYQICAKSVPESLNPFASLTVTYTVGAVSSFIIYLLMRKGGTIVEEIRHINWAPLIMGFTIVGLEVGYIYAYKAGWQVSMAQIIQASVLAVILIFVGYFAYKEALTINKIVGICICLLGLFILYRK